MANTKKSEMDAKQMLKDLADKNVKFKYRDRVFCEVVKDTKFYKKGQKIKPHRVMADQLIKEGIAKEVK